MAGESGLRESETSSCAWSRQPNGQDVEVCHVSKVEGLQKNNHWTIGLY